MTWPALLCATFLIAVLLCVSKGEALSLSCTQTLLAVQPCLDTPSGSACCNPAKAANDAKCLCDPGIFDLAKQYGVELDASNITQIALNCGFPITTVALAGTSNCPYGEYSGSTGCQIETPSLELYCLHIYSDDLTLRVMGVASCFRSIVESGAEVTCPFSELYFQALGQCTR